MASMPVEHSQKGSRIVIPLQKKKKNTKEQRLLFEPHVLQDKEFKLVVELLFFNCVTAVFFSHTKT